MSVELGRGWASTNDEKFHYYEPDILCLCNQAYPLYFFFAYLNNEFLRKVTAFKF
jgi:hypothetical protein